MWYDKYCKEEPAFQEMLADNTHLVCDRDDVNIFQKLKVYNTFKDTIKT